MQVASSASPHSHRWKREVKGEGSGYALNVNIQPGEYLGFSQIAQSCCPLLPSHILKPAERRQLGKAADGYEPFPARQGSGAALQRPHHSHFQACQAKGTVIASQIPPPPHFLSSVLCQGPGTGAPISACLRLLRSREVTESSPGAERAARRDSNQHSDKAGPC